MLKIERIAKTAQYHNYVSLFVIYLRFIITLVKEMFDLEIDKKKKKLSSMNKSCDKKTNST